MIERKGNIVIESQYSMLDMCDAAQSSIITARAEPPEVKPGDVWALGRHRLMCGDSTDSSYRLGYRKSEETSGADC